MIQRVQSVYLLLTALLSTLFLKGNILTFKSDAGTKIIMNIKEAFQLTETGSIGLIQNLIPALVILILILFLSFIAIFFFRKRKLQMKLVLGVLILTITFVAVFFLYSASIVNKYQTELVVGYKMFIPLLMILSEILAYRGIKKDEDLVKSYDRLR